MPQQHRVVLDFARPKRHDAAATFELIMGDDSMIGKGIAAGDRLRFRRSADCDDGDVAAVHTPDGLFVKVVVHLPAGGLRLEGAHPRCRVREYEDGAAVVLGVLADD
jgi:SOS-response transcriptional repressor LexA